MTTTPSGWPYDADAEASILPWLADEVPLPPNPAPSENDPSPPQPRTPSHPLRIRTSRDPPPSRRTSPAVPLSAERAAARPGAEHSRLPRSAYRPASRKAGVAPGRIRSRSTSVRTPPRSDYHLARADQSICSRSERASRARAEVRFLLGHCQQLRDEDVVDGGDEERHRRDLAAPSPGRTWHRRPGPRRSEDEVHEDVAVECLEQPSLRGRSGVIPAPTSASRPRSASLSRTKKSTSWSVGGPPRAHVARPPPRMKSTPDSLHAPAAFFIVSTSSGKLSLGV